MTSDLKYEVNVFLEEEGIDSISHLIEEIIEKREEYKILVQEGKENWK